MTWGLSLYVATYKHEVCHPGHTLMTLKTPLHSTIFHKVQLVANYVQTQHIHILAGKPQLQYSQMSRAKTR